MLLNSRSDVPLRLQVAHYLSKGGFDAADKRSIRAVSLLAHKFIMDVADEAMQITTRRSASRVAAGAAAAPAGLAPPPPLPALLSLVKSSPGRVHIFYFCFSFWRQRRQANADNRRSYARVAAKGREHI